MTVQFRNPLNNSRKITKKVFFSKNKLNNGGQSGHLTTSEVPPNFLASPWFQSMRCFYCITLSHFHQYFFDADTNDSEAHFAIHNLIKSIPSNDKKVYWNLILVLIDARKDVLFDWIRQLLAVSNKTATHKNNSDGTN